MIRQVICRVIFLIAFTIGALTMMQQALALTQEDIVGVWRTVDASDEEGRQQGGVVFRPDGTGEFMSTSWQTASLAELQLLQDMKTTGADNLSFSYEVNGSNVFTTITNFRGIPVTAKAVMWTATMNDTELELSAQDGTGKWIRLKRIL